MPENQDFKDLQYAFAKHIRDPENHAAPIDVEDRRLAVYRDLFFNNLSSLLGQTFPVLRRIHQQDRWQRLIRQFMQNYQAETPYFLQLPREFLRFLQNHYKKDEDDFPFLLELAHYEWVELALSVSEEENPLNNINPEGNLLEGTPVKSRLAWLCSYHYPVHRITPDFLPQEPLQTPVFIVVYRQSDDDIGFMELNPVTASLLERIEANTHKNGTALLIELAEEMNYSDTKILIQHGEQALNELKTAGILLGTKKPLQTTSHSAGGQ